MSTQELLTGYATYTDADELAASAGTQELPVSMTDSTICTITLTITVAGTC